MKINVKCMTEEAYKTLQKNCKDVYQMILDHPSDCSWLKEYLGFEPFETKKYTIEDFELKSDENYQNIALENGVTIYESLHELPKYIICNIRFWAWITFKKAYKQAISSTKLTSSDIIKNWWVPGNSRRELMLGVISRSYFRVDVSVDKSKPDKYELTKYLFTNLEIYRNISYRNIGMLKNVTLALLKVEYEKSIESGITLTKLQNRELMKEASRVGSVMLIDVMSADEIADILRKKLKRIINSKIDTKEEDEAD
jgi:hypothetical protein